MTIEGARPCPPQAGGISFPDFNLDLDFNYFKTKWLSLQDSPDALQNRNYITFIHSHYRGRFRRG